MDNTETETKIMDWISKNGSELLKMRRKYGFEYHDLATQEHGSIIMREKYPDFEECGVHFNQMDTRKNPSLNGLIEYEKAIELGGLIDLQFFLILHDMYLVGNIQTVSNKFKICKKI